MSDPFAKYGGTADVDPFAKYGGSADNKPALSADLAQRVANAPAAQPAYKQETARIQAEANKPDVLGGYVDELKRNAGKLKDAIFNTVPGYSDNPSTGNRALDLANGVMQTGVPTPAAYNPLPSTARAAQNFEKVMASTKNVPIPTENLQPIIDRAKELQNTGSTMPRVISRLKYAIENPQQLLVTEPNSGSTFTAEGVPYSMGKDFATRAGKLSVAERFTADAPMKAQVAKLAAELKDANRAAADTMGLGDVSDRAIDEYRAAMKLRGAAKAGAALAIPAAAGAVTGHYGAQGIIRKLANELGY